MGDSPPLVLIGVTGGVAAYKTCEVVRRLVERGRDVRCALTHDAERFIGPQLLAALTRRPVLDDRPVLGPSASRRARPTRSRSSPGASPTTWSRRARCRRRPRSWSRPP